jgi:hypothetical protein
MTSYAVSVNHFFSGFLYKNYLWFLAKRENSCMTQTVFCLEKVLAENIVMRHMAIVTIGFFAVRAVIPGGILWSHDMTVYTSLRLVAKI